MKGILKRDEKNAISYVATTTEDTNYMLFYFLILFSILFIYFCYLIIEFMHH